LRLPGTRDWFFTLFQRGDGRYYQKEGGSNVSSFYEMLPALMHLNLGGGEETRGVGHWMRHTGVNALIFPSARCNVGVTIQDSQLADNYGWNLIDYRVNPASPISNKIIDLSPWFSEVFRGIKIVVSNRRELLGTFGVTGVEEFHRDLFYKRLESRRVE
jgi:hypothetical protein